MQVLDWMEMHLTICALMDYAAMTGQIELEIEFHHMEYWNSKHVSLAEFAKRFYKFNF